MFFQQGQLSAVTLTTYIREDLRRRIASGTGPVRLTTTGLARLYDVSTTPVRGALQALADENVVRQLSNGRWIIDPEFARKLQNGAEARNDGAAETVAPEVDGSSIRGATDGHEAWRDEVVRWLLIRSLRGEGGFVREARVAEQFDIGRTRVRRVFHMMTGCGVLDHVPRRGWQVRVFQQSDMLAYVDIREILELRALELARPRLERREVQQMLAGNQQQPDVRLDNRLHDYFIECSQNRYIQTFFRTQGQYYRLLFDYAALEGRVVDEMAAQHREILEQVLRSRWARARTALSEHIRAQIPIINRVVQQLRSVPFDDALTSPVGDDGAPS